MVSKLVCCSDDFLTLSAGAQALFLQLQLEADDYGFVTNPRRVMRGSLRQEGELNELLESGFCIVFPSGHVVMRHWFVANNLDKRCKPLDEGEYASLKMAGNGSYFLLSEDFAEIPGNSAAAQAKAQAQALGKSLSPPSLEEVAAEIKRAGLQVDAAQFLADCEADGWKDGHGAPVRDWQKWLRGYAAHNRASRPPHGGKTPTALNFDQRHYTEDDYKSITGRSLAEAMARMGSGETS